MNLTQADILQILQILDETSYNHLHLEVDGLKLIVNKGKIPAYPQGEQDFSIPEPAGTDKKVKTDNQIDLAAEKGLLRDGSGGIDDAAVSEGLIPIRSPMLGTFYRSPKQGDQPYVEAGQVVDEETKVCIIEVMKLFTTIHAGVRGQIAKICAKDGQMVEYNQVLFLIDPQAEIEGL
ncbi:MAG: hypothetical protein K9K79_05600 [Desulfohalobiaceae bacterium]|nr:hypothetical protein [Desulfohalobiaceae bacterium]